MNSIDSLRPSFWKKENCGFYCCFSWLSNGLLVCQVCYCVCVTACMSVLLSVRERGGMCICMFWKFKIQHNYFPSLLYKEYKTCIASPVSYLSNLPLDLTLTHRDHGCQNEMIWCFKCFESSTMFLPTAEVTSLYRHPWKKYLRYCIILILIYIIPWLKKSIQLLLWENLGLMPCFASFV